jgi:small conductance mechanosensitive channel
MVNTELVLFILYWGSVCVIIAGGFWFAGKVASSLILKLGKKQGEHNLEIYQFLANSSRMAIYAIGAITLLGTMGIEVGPLVAGLGLSGFALSFALKDALANLLAGIMVFLYKPFRLGDLITVGADSGRVKRINLRYTHLETEENEILIPNSTLLTNNIIIKKNKS